MMFILVGRRRIGWLLCCMLLLFCISVTAATSTPSQKLEESLQLLRSSNRKAGVIALQALVGELQDIFDQPDVDVDTFMVLGMASYYMDEDDLALRAYQVVQQRTPNNPSPYFFTGLIYVYQNEMRLAEENLRIAHELAPSNPDYSYELARVYYNTERRDRALEYFRKTISYAPRHPEAHFYSGVVYATQEAWPEAIDMFTRAYTFDPDNLTALYNIAQVHLNLRNHQAALEHFELLAARVPDDWNVKAKMIQCLQALGDLVRRDQLRQELYDLRAKGTDKSLVDALLYTREVFDVPEKDLTVYVLEYFELETDRAKKFIFYVYDSATMRRVYEISVGSYELTTRVARELGEIGNEDRLYHMDGYCDGSHVAYAFYLNEPDYDKVRATVWDILTTQDIACPK